MHCDSYFVWIVQYVKMESCATLALTTICYVKVIVLLKVVFVKYYSAQCVLCSACMFYGPVVTTIRRRGGYRGIFGEEGVDTGVWACSVAWKNILSKVHIVQWVKDKI